MNERIAFGVPFCHFKHAAEAFIDCKHMPALTVGHDHDYAIGHGIEQRGTVVFHPFALLLEKLRDVPPDQWTARFRCVVAIASPAGGVWTVNGSVEGHIIDIPRGRNGFGYDPVF